MDDQLSGMGQPPEMPRVTVDDPYAVPSQPPMLPQRHARLATDAVGPTQDEKTMAMLVHLLGLLTGFIGVLILWAVKKNDSKFIDFHGREALNFMISTVIYSFVIVIVGVVLAIATMGFGMVFVIPPIIIFGIGILILEIMACIKANQGEWHRYPMTIRFIPDVR